MKEKYQKIDGYTEFFSFYYGENDKEESRHEPQNTWFYMPTQKEVEYEGKEFK